jgi:acyl dehydratase
MGRFRDRMDDDLRIRGYSANTRASYLRCVRHFVRHFMRPPDQLTPEHIRQYQLYLTRGCRVSWTSGDTQERPRSRRRRRAMRARPHERFSSEIRLTPALVAEYAQAAGDTNPIHRDPQFAASSRYGRLIASGTHTTALLLGLTASHFSKQGSMVGLEFWVRFRRPVFADETVRLEWLVVKVTPNVKLKGDVVELRGRIRGESGETALGAKGRVLVTERL